jgi:hypothetical protein
MFHYLCIAKVVPDQADVSAYPIQTEIDFDKNCLKGCVCSEHRAQSKHIMTPRQGHSTRHKDTTQTIGRYVFVLHVIPRPHEVLCILVIGYWLFPFWASLRICSDHVSLNDVKWIISFACQIRNDPRYKIRYFSVGVIGGNVAVKSTLWIRARTSKRVECHIHPAGLHRVYVTDSTA